MNEFKRKYFYNGVFTMNVIKNLRWIIVLGLPLTFMACSDSLGGKRIYLDGSRTRSGALQNITNSLNSDIEKIYNANRENIHINFSSSLNAADNINNSSDIISNCSDDTNTVAIVKKDDEYHLHINMEQETSKERQEIVLSCGLQELENIKQKNTQINNLINKVAQYQSGRSLKEFYDENTNNIQVNLRAFDTSSTSTDSSIFKNNLEITIDEDNSYKVSIDSRLEENVQAHLLAHSISIIKIETNDEIITSIPSISDRVPLSFSTIQEFYYNNEDSNQSILHPLEKSFIEAIYFYSRFHAYSMNQRLKEEGLVINHNLSDEDIISKLLTELENKNLLTDITRQSDGQNLLDHANRRVNDFLRATQNNAMSNQNISK